MTIQEEWDEFCADMQVDKQPLPSFDAITDAALHAASRYSAMLSLAKERPDATAIAADIVSLFYLTTQLVSEMNLLLGFYYRRAGLIGDQVPDFDKILQEEEVMVAAAFSPPDEPTDLFSTNKDDKCKLN